MAPMAAPVPAPAARRQLLARQDYRDQLGPLSPTATQPRLHWEWSLAFSLLLWASNPTRLVRADTPFRAISHSLEQLSDQQQFEADARVA